MKLSILRDTQYIQRGELIEATVLLELEKPLKRVRSISAQFHAAERAEADYTVTTSDSDGGTKTEVRTAVDYHDIVKEDFQLRGDPSPGFLRGMLDSMATLVGAGSGSTMEAGKHEFPVAFTIPEDAPASLTGEKASIFYTLSVRVDRAMGRDPRESRDFKVRPLESELVGEPIVVHYPEEDGRGFWERTFGKNADLAMAIKSDVFKPGDELEALVTVNTESTMKIRKATAQLFCVEKTRADGYTDSAQHESEPIVIADKREIFGEFSTRFTLPVESLGPPTMSAHNFDIEWYVEVTFDVPWAADPQIRVPIRVLYP